MLQSSWFSGRPHRGPSYIMAGLDIVDSKVTKSPPVFDGSEKGWKEAKFSLLTFLVMVSESVVARMEGGASSQNELPMPPDEDDKRVVRWIYNFLAQQLRGRAMKMLRGVPERNGLEAWRRIVQDYEPDAPSRHFGLLMRVINVPEGHSGIPRETPGVGERCHAI